MTDLQKCEYELLKCAVQICNLNKLKYYLTCGSALGAVKYGGFIPWDDDIDIALPRPDYDIFCKVSVSLMPSYYFLQSSKTDSNFRPLSSKLRDLRTTFIESNVGNIDIVHGVYIDIFPLDSYPSQKNEQKKYINRIRYFERRRSLKHLNNKSAGKKFAIRTRLLFFINKLTGIYNNTGEFDEKLNKFLSESYYENAEIWCNHHEETNENSYHRREEYGDGVNVVFENLRVRAPTLYDEYLTKRYGDWRADLPPEQQVGHHYAEVIDVNRPYTDYIVKLGKGKIRLKTSAELTRDGIPIPEGYRY